MTSDGFPPHEMSRPARTPRSLRSVGWTFLVVGAILLTAGVAYPYWACHLLTWKCPATGCGSAPAQLCLSAEGLASFLLIFGFGCLLMSSALLLSRHRREMSVYGR